MKRADRDRVVDEAIEKAGGLRSLARAIEITPQAIENWHRVPAHHAIAIERTTGIPRERMRPDIYPPNERRKVGIKVARP